MAARSRAKSQVHGIHKSWGLGSRVRRNGWDCGQGKMSTAHWYSAANQLLDWYGRRVSLPRRRHAAWDMPVRSKAYTPEDWPQAPTLGTTERNGSWTHFLVHSLFFGAVLTELGGPRGPSEITRTSAARPVEAVTIHDETQSPPTAVLSGITAAFVVSNYAGRHHDDSACPSQPLHPGPLVGMHQPGTST